MSNSFNTDEPLAYFLTWTTYGTWLPGDERGWVRKHEPVQAPNALFVEMAQAQMKEPAYHLSAHERQIVEDTIRAHADKRNWPLHAINARSNHIHVVLTAAGYRPKVVRDQLKAWCTRKLKHSGIARERFWTEGGSCRWINTEDDLQSAILYVIEGQDGDHFASQ
jgi:hypothetical protein